MLITFADSPPQSELEAPKYRETHERKFPSEKSDGRGKCVEHKHYHPEGKAEQNQACLDLDLSQSNIRKCFFKVALLLESVNFALA